MAAAQAPQLKLQVDSAGTADYHIGSPPDSRSRRAALRRGIDISDLRARQIEGRDFDRFDMILAMDGENLEALTAMQPRNSHARLQLFLDYAPGQGTGEVPDPYYGDERAFETVLDLATAASRGLLAELQKRA